MQRIPLFLACLVLFLVLGVSSCGVRSEGILQSGGDMDIAMDVSIHPVFQAYLTDLSGVGVADKGGFFDRDRIRRRLEGLSGVTVPELSVLSRGTLKVRIHAKDPEQAFRSAGNGLDGLLSLEGTGSGNRTLELVLNRDVVKGLMGLVTSEAGEDARYLLPQREDVTAQEYRKSLDWALEEYGSKEERGRMFDGANLSFTLRLPSPVQSSRGFIVKDRQKGIVSLEISLVDLMVLRDEKKFLVTF